MYGYANVFGIPKNRIGILVLKNRIGVSFLSRLTGRVSGQMPGAFTGALPGHYLQSSVANAGWSSNCPPCHSLAPDSLLSRRLQLARQVLCIFAQAITRSSDEEDIVRVVL